MKILLVNPSCVAESGRDLYSAHLIGPLSSFQPNSKMTLGLPLALPTLAAHTPPEHTVIIVDEEIEIIDFDQPVDLVGITAMTFKARRAYQIAEEFRSRGVPVVMGGIHASMCPEEAAARVDAVVIGEAEELWPQVLADTAAGRLKKRYQAANFPDLRQSLPPRYDLVKNRQYLFSYLQTSRGCPFDCHFCTVTQQNGRVVRKKSVDQVLAELDLALRWNSKRQFRMIDRASGRKRTFVGQIALIDDNFAIDREHALGICAALRDYQDRHDLIFIWYTQVNFTVGFDQELLRALADAHCQHLFIGFESLDPGTLQQMNKSMNNPARYGEAIRNIQSHGIRVVYSTIVGDDGTTPESAESLTGFIERSDVFHVLLNILTPYPGTALRRELEGEKRLLDENPQLYNIRNVVFRPRRLTPRQLNELYQSLCGRLFEYREVYRRGRRLLDRTDRLYLPALERLGAWLGFSATTLILAARRQLPGVLACRLLGAAPRLLLGSGSLFALELLCASADYDDFARSELGRAKLEPRQRELAATLGRVTRTYPLHSKNRRSSRHFRAFLLSSAELASLGIAVPPENRKRPILLLGGTSLPFEYRKDLIAALASAGFEVASIENPLGGIFDAAMNPPQERLDSLKTYLDLLRSSDTVTAVDIVAHSYSAFEVARVCLEDPEAYRKLVKSITLINPPGLNERVGFLRHLGRFFWHHVLVGQARTMLARTGLAESGPGDAPPQDRDFVKREIRGINAWLIKTLKNPVRSLKEARDITSFKLKRPLQRLQDEYFYDINIFLQKQDQLIPPQATLAQVRDIFPENRIRMAPGSHNDLFFQKWQHRVFVDFLKQTRARSQNPGELAAPPAHGPRKTFS